MPHTKLRTWLPAYLLLALIWGNSFLFIKVAVRELHPLQLSFARVAIGGLTLLVVLAATRQRLPRDRRLWVHVAVVSVLLTTVPFTLFGYGERHISSVLAGIWNATTPLWTLLFAVLLLPLERPTRARAAGLALGFAGVLIVLGVWRPMSGGTLAGSLACVGAATCYGIGGVYLRKYVTHRPESPVVLSAAQLVAGTGQLLVIAPAVGVPPLPTSAAPEVWLSVLLLGALGTGLAYLLMYRVIRAAGVTTGSTVTYLIPLFAAVAGVTVLDEGLTWNQPAGALVVLAGVAVSQGLLPARRPAGSPGEPAESPEPVSGAR